MKVVACGLLLLLPKAVLAAGENLHFSGNLVAEPCLLDPNTTEITLNFNTVVSKYLYTHVRTQGKPFTVRLLECDLSIGKTATLTFSGTESLALPGMLALNGGSASGIAMGIETPDGKALPLNKASDGYQLVNGDNEIALLGYVQGEPEAILHRTITPGDFTATANFEVAYP